MRRVRLNNYGPATLRAEVTVDGNGVEPRSRVLSIPGGASDQPSSKLLELEFDSTILSGEASLVLSASLGAPSTQQPWETRVREERRFSLKWNTSGPGRLVVLTPTLLFHGRRGLTRMLRVCNEGDLPIQLVLPTLTHGFAFTSETPRQSNVMPKEEYCIPIEYIGPTPMPSQTLTATLTTSTNTVDFNIIAEAESSGSFRPDWIIGVDFGTSNTSIVARSVPCEGPPEKGACCPIPDLSGDDRFASAMYYHFKERRWDFGAKALQAAENQGASNSGYLISDHNSLKMSLNVPGEFYHNDPIIKQNQSAIGLFTVDNLLRTYFTYLKDTLVHPFISRQPASTVQFVLSLPVLDGIQGERYNLQRDRMLSAFSHVFHTPIAQIITELEPNCASRFLLFGQGYEHLRSLIPHAGSLFQPGERFMVVDSGGGTTDISFGEFEEGIGGVLPFRILGNLGLGNTSGVDEDFGGRKMSNFLHTELNSASTEQFHHAPCDLMPHLDGHTDSKLKRRTCSAISTEIENSIKAPYCREDPPEGLPVELVHSTSAFAKSQMTSLLRSLHKTHPEAFEKKLRWLFLVGGNTLVRAIQSFCLDMLAGNDTKVMPELSPKDRFLAVALGSVFADGLFIPEYCNYDLTLSLIDEAGLKSNHPLQARSAPITEFSKNVQFNKPVQVVLRANEFDLVRQNVGDLAFRTVIRASIGAHGVRLTSQQGPSSEIVLYEATL